MATAKSRRRLGFLTVLEHEQQGLVGGYLILNTAGRPLEFHCTAPLKPNRAQQILFGPTLEPYLYGEQIGQTLVAKGSLEPLAVCTDVERALSRARLRSLPVALVLRGASRRAAATDTVRHCMARRCGAAAGPALARSSHSDAIDWPCPPTRDADRQTIAERLEALADFDLSEPFGRIREAVEEAHRGAARLTRHRKNSPASVQPRSESTHARRRPCRRCAIAGIAADGSLAWTPASTCRPLASTSTLRRWDRLAADWPSERGRAAAQYSRARSALQDRVRPSRCRSFRRS